MRDWTRSRLNQWGRWCREKPRTGYPTQAAFVNAGSGGRCCFDVSPDMPDDIKDVEDIVNRMSRELQQVVRQEHIKRGMPRFLKALRIGINLDAYKTRLRIAEAFIDRELAGKP